MRLSSQQQQLIAGIVRQHLGPDVGVSLFGSRTNDHKRGGDVDLVVVTPRDTPLMRKAGLKLALEDAIGLPVDVVFVQSGKTRSAFQALAVATAERLEPPTP